LYLHLGGDVLIKTDEVVAIIDLEVTKIDHINHRSFDTIKENNNNICYISEPGREKTLVVTINNLYYSPISTNTLYKRSSSSLAL